MQHRRRFLIASVHTLVGINEEDFFDEISSRDHFNWKLDGSEFLLRLVISSESYTHDGWT